MPYLSAPPLDPGPVFHALSDPTRRAVVERLGRGPASMTALAVGAGMALPSFAQHLGVLEKCGLVSSTKSGRVRTYQINDEPLLLAEGWMTRQRNVWTTRLDQLDAYLLEPETSDDP